MLKLYLDDLRPAPSGWKLCRTVEEVIDILKEFNNVSHISLDNDLGDGYQEGYKVLDFLEEKIYLDPMTWAKSMPEISVHSANPVRHKYILQVIDRIDKIKQLKK